MKGQRHAHAAFHKALGLAKQAQVGVGHAQCLIHAVKHDAFSLCAAVNSGAGAGGFSAVFTGMPGMARACNSNSLCTRVVGVTRSVLRRRGLTLLNHTPIAFHKQAQAAGLVVMAQP